MTEWQPIRFRVRSLSPLACLACLLSAVALVHFKATGIITKWEIGQLSRTYQRESPLQNTSVFQKYFVAHNPSRVFWKPSHYLSAYDEHLARFLNYNDVHLAEVVGAHNEGSLEMWRKVFGPGLNLYGIERTKAVPNHAKFGARMFRWAEPSFWAQFRQQVPLLDILVVAGVAQQEFVQALEGALKHLRLGGILILENFHVQGIDRKASMQELFLRFKNLHAGRRKGSGSSEPDPMQASIESVHFYPWMLVVSKTLELRDNMNAPRHGSIWNPIVGGVTQQKRTRNEYLQPWWHDPPSLRRDPSNKFLEFFLNKAVGHGIWKPLHYFPAYNKYLAKFEAAPEFHFAEIGIYSGGSLEMWRAVFGEGLHLYGIDIANITKVYEQLDTTGRTRIFIADQTDQRFWETFRRKVPRLDVLIDDGGHKWFQQKAALDGALDHLRPGGVYITEDCHSMGKEAAAFDYFASLHDAVPPDSLSHMQQTIESVSYYPWLIVVQKADALRHKLDVTKVP